MSEEIMTKNPNPTGEKKEMPVALERLWNGLAKENPTFVLMLGMCPTLANTLKSDPRYFSIVCAFAGLSTITKFFAIYTIIPHPSSTVVLRIISKSP